MNYAMYNPSYNQHRHEIIGPGDEIEKQWRINLSDSINNTPVAVNGTLYLSDQNNNLYEVGGKNGQIRNCHRTEGDVVGIPARDGDEVYVGAERSGSLTIYRFTGSEKGPVAEFQVPAYGEISVRNGRVYCLTSSDDDLVGAFDGQTGEKLWTTTLSPYGSMPKGTSKPIVAGDFIYVPCSNAGGTVPSFFVVNRKDGSIVDSFSDDTRFIGHTNSTVAVADGVVYFATDREAYAVDAEACEEIWNRSLEGARQSGSPIIRDGVMYFGTWDGRVRALNTETGEHLWTFKIDQSVRSTPAVVNGTVYIGANDCTLYALDAETGEKVWSYETESEIESSPLVTDGMIYVGTYFGNLYAFG